MDIAQFRIDAAQHKKQLTAFLDGLAEKTEGDLSEIAAEADAEAWKKVDCLDCANCCKTMTPAFTKQVVARIATHLPMKPADFAARWLKKEKDAEDFTNASSPCQFLNGNKCTIYEVRPADCAGFPHHDKRPLKDYMITFRKNVSHCPATYEFVTRLRAVLEGGVGDSGVSV